MKRRTKEKGKSINNRFTGKHKRDNNPTYNNRDNNPTDNNRDNNPTYNKRDNNPRYMCCYMYVDMPNARSRTSKISQENNHINNIEGINRHR